MTDVEVSVDYPIVEVSIGGMPGVKGDIGPAGDVSTAQLNAALAEKVSKAGDSVTGLLTVGVESPAAPQGPELGTGTGLTQTVTTVVGQTYQVGGTGVTAVTVDGAPLVMSAGWSSFVATAAQHTLVGTGGTTLSVKQVTGTVASLMTVGGQIEIRRRGNNTAIGQAAQRSLTTGVNNTAIGNTAQYALTTGVNNTAIGQAAQYALTTGGANTAVGRAAQYLLTTGGANTAVGNTAQYLLTTGGANTAVGNTAQRSLTTGANNTAIGQAAQYHASQNPAVNGSVAIGTDSASEGAYTTEDNTIVLGTTRHRVVMRGPGKGIEMVAPDGTRWNVTVANGGTLNVAAA